MNWLFTKIIPPSLRRSILKSIPYVSRMENYGVLNPKLDDKYSIVTHESGILKITRAQRREFYDVDELEDKSIKNLI
jgi:hypothetical protein